MSGAGAAKGGFNIGGVKVEITQLQNPFPHRDPVFPLEYRITTGSPRLLMGAQARLVIEYDGGPQSGMTRERITVAELTPEAARTAPGRHFEFPCQILPGDTLIDRLRIPLKAGTFADFVARRHITMLERPVFLLRVSVDVKGTPFDPFDDAEFSLI